jgi:GH25 family lysozyme M1 (1,4-beta-N-acetylmuramidase)
MDLSTAGWVKRGPIEEHPVPGIDLSGRNDFRDFSLELAQKGIVIVQAISHTEYLLVSLDAINEGLATGDCSMGANLQYGPMIPAM